MPFRKLLISLSLLALMGVVAWAQDQTSQTANQQPQTSQPQSTQPSTTPVPPQDPSSTPSSTPAPPADSSASTDSQTAPQGEPPVQEPDESKVKHDGSEKDVDAIGNRKVGGRGLGDWYSLESEIRMGKQYAMQVEQSVKLVQDPVVNEYVNRIGQNLVRNSDAKEIGRAHV